MRVSLKLISGGPIQWGRITFSPKKIADLAYAWPTWSIVMLILLPAMFLSDLVNNAATAVLMSQLSVGVAEKLNGNAEPLLVAFAIRTS